MTIIFSTHILSDADEISDELLLLHKGKLVETGSLASLRLKYQTAVIELQFDDAAKNYMKRIEALPSVHSCSIARDKIGRASCRERRKKNDNAERQKIKQRK